MKNRIETDLPWVGPGPITRFAQILLGLAFAVTLPAAPVTHDLGEGLTYLRVTTLPADLPAQKNLRACVLDLRYATGDAAAAVALAGWLKFHGSVRTPVFILANAATATPLLDVMIPGALPAGTLTLGVPGPGFVPDLTINTLAETELSAFAVLAQGTPPADLLRENSDKTRYDEAAMVRDLARGERPSATEPTPLVPKAAATPPTPPVDRTLQRAVHVHRGLTALRLLRG